MDVVDGPNRERLCRACNVKIKDNRIRFHIKSVTHLQCASLYRQLYAREDTVEELVEKMEQCLQRLKVLLEKKKRDSDSDEEAEEANTQDMSLERE